VAGRAVGVSFGGASSGRGALRAWPSAHVLRRRRCRVSRVTWWFSAPESALDAGWELQGKPIYLVKFCSSPLEMHAGRSRVAGSLLTLKHRGRDWSRVAGCQLTLKRRGCGLKTTK
jgi:hypothetical protein